MGIIYDTVINKNNFRKEIITTPEIEEFVTSPDSEFRIMVIIAFVVNAIQIIFFLVFCIDKAIKFFKFQSKNKLKHK